MRVQKKVEFERSARGPTPGEWVEFHEVEVSGNVVTVRGQYEVTLDAGLDLRDWEIERAEDALIEALEEANSPFVLGEVA